MSLNAASMAELTSFNEKMDSFENKMALLETKILNPLGYIPIVSSFSAGARASFSWIQGIAFAVLAAFYEVESLKAKGNEAEVLHEKTWRCLNEMGHAVLNHGRAEVEAVPILGNVATLTYDFVLKERFKYPKEALNPMQAVFKENYDKYAPVIRELLSPYYNDAKKTVDQCIKMESLPKGT